MKSDLFGPEAMTREDAAELFGTHKQWLHDTDRCQKEHTDCPYCPEDEADA